MTDSIDPVMTSTKVVSNYSRAYAVGDRVIMSHVEHVSDKGSTTVSETRHVTYDSLANVEDSNEIEESKVDKKV